MNSAYLPAVCPHDCPSACALEVECIDTHTIGRIRGAKENDYTQGVICAKVARYAERVHHRDRLLWPLRRVGAKGAGRFSRISWDEAMSELADNLQRVAAEQGPEAVWPYYYGGTMGQLQRDGINRLRHLMGYSGQKKTICTSIAYSGWQAGVGAVRGSDPREIANSDLIVIWGCNAVSTQVNVMTLVSKARKNRGAKLVVIDPCRTPTAEKADLHLMPAPGTDGALACALMQQLFENKYADWPYLEKFTDSPREFAAHLASRTPDWAAPITGISPREIEAFADLYGKNRRSFIRLGIGFSRSRNGAHNVHAVSCLPAVTGAWQYPGGGALLATSDLFHLDKTLIEGLDALDSGTRMLDMSRIGPVLCGDRADLAGGPPVKAMLIQNTNPMAVAPGQAMVKEGFARDDLFVCVHEQFLTETARMADIVLPATSFLEHEDLYQSYGQTYLQVGRQVISPPGECRSNHQLICDLAQYLGVSHPGFDMTAEEIVDATLKASDYPDLTEMTERRWLDCSRSFEEMNFLKGFDWPDGRFRFKPDWEALGKLGATMPEYPDHWAVTAATDPRYPLRLITPPARTFLNTSFTETPTSRKKEAAPRLLIHTEDAGDLGITEGCLVLLGNAQGQLTLPARVSENLKAGVVAVEGIWPGDAFTGGRGINLLTSADAAAPCGGAVFHDTAVWLKPV